MGAGADFADGIHGLAIFREIHAFGKFLEHGELIGIHDQFFIARGQSAFEPACGMQTEIHARQDCRPECIGAFIGGLGVRDFRTAESSAGAERHPQAPRQLGGTECDMSGFWCAESRRTGLH